jgi:hypothetical protein
MLLKSRESLYKEEYGQVLHIDILDSVFINLLIVK